MNHQVSKQPLLRLRFQGSAIHDGRILFDDLSTFVANISLAIERIINTVSTGESIKRGRPLKAMSVISALEIVSMRKSSFGIGLDLRRNGHRFPGWDLGEQATDILVQGLGSIEKDEPLPKEYNHGVLMALRDAGKIIDRGVEKININTQSSFGVRKAKYTQPMRTNIILRIRRFEQAYTIVEGRLLSADVKEDKLRCRIEPSIGEPIPCKFDESITTQVLQLMREFVQARGEATYDIATGKITSLDIKDLETIEEASGIETAKVPLSSFWKSKSFEELASEQGVYPLDDIANITGGWPEDEDVDSFLSAIRSSRRN